MKVYSGGEETVFIYTFFTIFIRPLLSLAVGHNSKYIRKKCEPELVLTHVLIAHMKQMNEHTDMHILFQQEINKTFIFISRIIFKDIFK